MTEPNLSALTKMEQLVFGADAKKDAEGNIIEQGSGNLHDRVKKVEAALKAAVPNIAPETAANLAQSAVVASASQSVGVPVQPVPAAPVTPAPTTPAAVTVAPAPVTPAPVAVAPTPNLGSGAPAPSSETSAPPVAPVVTVESAPTPATAPVATTTPAPVTVAAVQSAVPAAPPAVVAAVVATAHPAATHETLVARVKAFLAEAESKIEEIL